MEKPPIEEVLRHYGLTGNVPPRMGWGKVKCPFHDDSNASASVNLDTNQFRCFACDIDSPLDNGKSSAVDSFDIIAWKEGCDDFPSTKQAAEDILGERYGDVLQGAKGKPRRRVFGESGPKRGQRNAFSSRVRRRTFGGA